MRQHKRQKVTKEWLENQLDKYSRRIQKLADNAYQIRQAIEAITAQEVQRTIQKGETDNAICETAIEAGLGSGGADTDTGESELLNNEIIDTVLAEQPTELPVDK